MNSNAKTERAAAPAAPLAKRATPKKKAHQPQLIEPEEMKEITEGLPTPWAARLRRMRALGMQQRQVVFELHCRQGRSLAEVGEMLGITKVAAVYHWRQVQKMLGEEAPRTPEQMVMLREEIAARLRATIDETHLRKEVVAEDGQVTTVPAPPTPQLLAIRLRALEQLTRLYDLNLEQPPAVAMADGSPLPSRYVTPEALAEEVRVRRLELHGRGHGHADGPGDVVVVGGAEFEGGAEISA